MRTVIDRGIDDQVINRVAAVLMVPAMLCQAELATAAIHSLPTKCLIINNNFLGMVRQWQELFFENRLSGVDLVGNPDFVKLAQAYGIKAWRIRRPSDVDRILAEAHAYDEGPAPCSAISWATL